MMPAARPNAPRFLSGIILAAGASTRMGRPKQLLTLGDRPLLQRVLDEAASSCLDEVILVLGHRAPAVRRAIRIPKGVPVRVVVNPNFAQGQSASLRLGLRSADERAEAAIVLLGDQPGIRSELIERVAEAFTTAGSAAVRPVYRRSDGGREPGHPVLLARRIWPEVEKLRGDHGARALFSRHPDWLLEIPVDAEPPDDIDTLADYERALADAQARAAAGSDAVRL